MNGLKLQQITIIIVVMEEGKTCTNFESDNYNDYDSCDYDSNGNDSNANDDS